MIREATFRRAPSPVVRSIADAIGPFEMSEYLGLALIYAALAVTAPEAHE